MITLPSTKHFHTETFIENLEDCLNQVPALSLCLEETEEDALRLVLGDCLYKEFKDQFDLTATGYELKVAAAEKWKWLLNGRTYDYDGFKPYPCGCGCVSSTCKKINYPGMVKKYQVTATKSFEKNYLAYYIYYNWKTINETITAGTGEQLPQVKNSTTVYNKKKRYNAWNRFADWVQELNTFLYHHKEDFPSAVVNCNLHRLNIYDI